MHESVVLEEEPDQCCVHRWISIYLETRPTAFKGTTPISRETRKKVNAQRYEMLKK